MPYIKREKVIANFQEQYDEYGRKKKSGLGKKLLIGAGATVGALAATKYGAKSYANLQGRRAKAARSAAYEKSGSNVPGKDEAVKKRLLNQADKIESGSRTKVARNIGNIGDKQIGQVKKFLGSNIDKARMSLARDKDKYKQEKQQAFQRRVSAAHRNQQRNLEGQQKLSKKMRKEAELRDRYSRLANPQGIPQQ